MQTGISTATLFKRRFNEDALARFAEWGVQTTEVFLTSFSEYDAQFAHELAARKGALPVHSVHVLNTQFEPQLYNDHPRVKGDAFGWLSRVMESARVLGAAYYTFHGIARIKRTYRENLPALGRGTQEIAAFCENYGVTLSYENVEWAIYNRPSVYRALKAECPALKGVLDIKQARISGYDWREYLDEMGRDLVTVHVSDVDDGGKMCLPGQGNFPFDELISRLADVGFAGAVLIENYSGDYKDEEELLASYRYLQELVARHGG